MPQLAALFKKFESEGLHIVGLECQGSAASAIKSMAGSKGATYQMTTGGQLKGAKVNGIPHGFLFDATGKLVDGDWRPSAQFETKLKEMLKESAAAMAGPGPYTKLAPMVAQLKAGAPCGQVLKSAAAKMKSSDPVEAEEAKTMVEAIRGNGTAQFERAQAKKSDDPLAAVTKLDKLALQFAGDELGTKAKAEADAIRKDPVLKKEIDAELMWKKISAMNDTLKPVRGAKDPKDEAFKKLNMEALQGIIGGCVSLTKQFAGTKAAAKAEGLMSEYK